MTVLESPPPAVEPLATYRYRPDPPSRVLSDMWRLRAFLPKLALRMVLKAITGTKLGALWLFLRPALQIFGMTLLLGEVLKAPSSGVPYLIFLLVGMIGWLAFDRIVLWSTRSFDVYRRHAARLRFPLLFVPLASSGFAVLQIGVMTIFLAGAVAAYEVGGSSSALSLGVNSIWLLPGLALAALFGLGLGLWLSVANAYARDVRIALRYVLQVWLYLTPVLYAPEALSGALGTVADINPVTAPVLLVKHALLNTELPTGDQIATALIGTIVVLGGGLAFFHQMAWRAPGLQARVGDSDADDYDE